MGRPRHHPSASPPSTPPRAHIRASLFTIRRTPRGGAEQTLPVSGVVFPAVSGARTDAGCPIEPSCHYLVLRLSAHKLVSTDTDVKVSYTKPAGIVAFAASPPA